MAARDLSALQLLTIYDYYKSLPQNYKDAFSTSLNSVNLVDQDLVNHLRDSGVKMNEDEIVMTVETPNGDVLWLEEGNENAGLQHIIENHKQDFVNKGITNIPNTLKELLQMTPANTGVSKAGPYADFVYNGEKYRVAYGTNGYIVSFYPYNDN